MPDNCFVRLIRWMCVAALTASLPVFASARAEVAPSAEMRVAEPATVLHLAKMSSTEQRIAEQVLRDKKTPYGVPLTDKMRFRTRDNIIMSVPVEFLAGWAAPQFMDKIVDSAEGIQMLFWMPDKSMSLQKTIPPLVYPHGPQPGHEERKDGEFLVHASHVQFGVEPYEQNEERNDPVFSANKFIKNLRDRAVYRTSNFIPIKAEYGFTVYNYLRLHDNYIISSYHLYESDDLVVMMKCPDLHEKLANYICQADVYFEIDRLAFTVRFPRQDLKYWRETVTAVRDFAVAWREPASP